MCSIATWQSPQQRTKSPSSPAASCSSAFPSKSNGASVQRSPGSYPIWPACPCLGAVGWTNCCTCWASCYYDSYCCQPCLMIRHPLQVASTGRRAGWSCQGCPSGGHRQNWNPSRTSYRLLLSQVACPFPSFAFSYQSTTRQHRDDDEHCYYYCSGMTGSRGDVVSDCFGTGFPWASGAVFLFSGQIASYASSEGCPACRVYCTCPEIEYLTQ